MSKLCAVSPSSPKPRDVFLKKYNDLKNPIVKAARVTVKQTEDKQAQIIVEYTYSSKKNKLEWVNSEKQLLGKGVFGKVYRGTFNTQACAIKVTTLKKHRKLFSEEVRIQLSLSHSHIVTLLSGAVDFNYINPVDAKKFSCWAVPVEQVEKPEKWRSAELFDFFALEGRELYDEKLARRIVYEVATGLAYLHGCGVTHFDIKPENILVNSTFNFKLADFGLAKKYNKTTGWIENFRGSPLYAAPELAGKDLKSVEGPKAEMFSLGILMYVTLFGGALCKTDQQIVDMMIEGTYENHIATYGKWCKNREGYFANVSVEAATLLAKLIHVNPAKRPTAEEVLKDLWLRTTK